MKIAISVILMLIVLTFAGCGRSTQGSPVSAGSNNSNTQTTQTLMDKAELRAVAYGHAGVSEADVYDIDDDWEKRAGTTVYELDFEAFGVEYEYDLDGTTGKILFSNTKGTPAFSETELITQEEAKQIALTHAGLTEEQVTGLRIELDREDNDYEIEFRSGGFEYDYEIDAMTGQILRSEKDRD